MADFKSEICLEESVIASESKHDFDVPKSAAPKSQIDKVKPISYQKSIIFHNYISLYELIFTYVCTVHRYVDLFFKNCYEFE